MGWFEWATYATSMSLEITQIMMKYMGTIDRDNSMSLDHSEFAYSYAAMTHTAAEAIFSVLDENSDGQLTGKSCSYSTTRTVRDDRVRTRSKFNLYQRWWIWTLVWNHQPGRACNSSKDWKSCSIVCKLWNVRICDQKSSHSLRLKNNGPMLEGIRRRWR